MSTIASKQESLWSHWIQPGFIWKLHHPTNRMISAPGGRQQTTLTVSLSINTTGALQCCARQPTTTRHVLAAIHIVVTTAEAVRHCCVLHVQAVEPGTFAALWIKCQATPQPVFGGSCPQVPSPHFDEMHFGLCLHPCYYQHQDTASCWNAHAAA